MKIFVTVDVELWPNSWETYRADFPSAFDRYILGRTSRGTVGLPLQLQMAKDHGLRFVFFVESLFACEFGGTALQEIVHMIQEEGQEVQLHAHPEWVRHSAEPFITTGERYVFREFSSEEQFQLVSRALANLTDAGARNVRAFRAGSFAGNAQTFSAVARAGLSIDSSFKLGAQLGQVGGTRVDGYVRVGDVAEYPLTVFQDWPGHRRHLQLGACSWGELVHVVRRAGELDWDAVVILSHSVELLNGDRTRPDLVAMRRFERFCRSLADGELQAATAWFGEEDTSHLSEASLAPIESPVWRTVWRTGEQAVRRLWA